MARQLKNVTKVFGERAVLNSFSYTFENAGLYALVGRSGAGNTTLLRLIAGLDKDFKGTIEGFGTVSYAFQEYRLFDSLNALQNVYELAFSQKTDENVKLAKNLLLSLGFTSKELSLMPRELSGGMKQRVSLCRALLYPADTYLFDEPFKELDPTLVRTVKQKLLELAKEHAVILSVHSDEECELLGATAIKVDE